MNKNPLYSPSGKTKSLPAIDIEVTHIYGGNHQANYIYDAVKLFCKEHGIEFSSRHFDSSKYEHDATMISSLPSFYVSKKKSSCPFIVFTPENVLDCLKIEYLLCVSRIEEKKKHAEEKQVTWNRWFGWFTRLGKPKQVATTKPKS